MYNCQLRQENTRTPFKQVTFFSALISKRLTMSFSLINDLHIAHAQSMKEESIQRNELHVNFIHISMSVL